MYFVCTKIAYFGFKFLNELGFYISVETTGKGKSNFRNHSGQLQHVEMPGFVTFCFFLFYIINMGFMA